MVASVSCGSVSSVTCVSVTSVTCGSTASVTCGLVTSVSYGSVTLSVSEEWDVRVARLGGVRVSVWCRTCDVAARVQYTAVTRSLVNGLTPTVAALSVLSNPVTCVKSCYLYSSRGVSYVGIYLNLDDVT